VGVGEDEVSVVIPGTPKSQKLVVMPVGVWLKKFTEVVLQFTYSGCSVAEITLQLPTFMCSSFRVDAILT
jgi:hypothetical protein